jgi:cyanate permease
MRAAGETPRAVNPAGGYDFSLSEALCSYPFWIFNWALALPAMIGTAVTFHVVDLGARVGLSEAQAVGLFPLMALFSVSTTIAGGWISDRVRVRYLLFVMVTAQAAGCLGILDLGHASGQWLLIVGFGVSGGLFALLMTIIWPRFFGRTHLGAISSVNMSVVVFASAIGPWAFAFSQEYNGDYAPAAVASAAFALACLVAALWVENPQLRLHR